MYTSSAPFDFIFKVNADADFTSLKQGDLLRKTDRLVSALKEGHDYYAEAESYNHFMVLTQSCDLVVRSKKGFKSPYITICAVRPLARFLEKKIPASFYDFSIPLRLGRIELYEEAARLIERLISNTVEDVFFLGEGSSDSLVEPSCAFLQLSVALKADHYDVCVGAKVAEMTEIFAAKVGWQTGNLYSRIGTPDIIEKKGETIAKSYRDELVSATLEQDTVWLNQKHASAFMKEITRGVAASGSEPSRKLIEDIVSSLPKPIDELSDVIVRLIRSNGFLNDTAKLEELRGFIASSAKVKRLLGS